MALRAALRAVSPGPTDGGAVRWAGGVFPASGRRDGAVAVSDISISFAAQTWQQSGILACEPAGGGGDG
ncbi:MAG: hypothetical protein OEU25_11845, partial [Rhodospirillales bacterium]|nr:hypothetical protein [Rhodospirillales bacterium]